MEMKLYLVIDLEPLACYIEVGLVGVIPHRAYVFRKEVDMTPVEAFIVWR
jgi:hypothetical protein